MTLPVRLHRFGKCLAGARQLFEHEQKRNDAVVGIKVFAKIIMRAHLAGEDRIFFSHAILDESVATLCDDGLRTMLLADFHRRPDHAWIKNDLVPAAALG